MKLKYNPQDVVKAISIKFPVIEADIKEAEKIISDYNTTMLEVNECVENLLDTIEYKQENELVKKRWFGEDVFNTKTYVNYDSSFIDNLNVKVLYESARDLRPFESFKRCEVGLEFKYSAQDHDLVVWEMRHRRFTQLTDVDTESVVELFYPHLSMKNNDYNKLKDILESCNTSAKEVYFTEEGMELFKRNGINL